MEIWVLRPPRGGGGERGEYLWRALRKVWAGHGFHQIRASKEDLRRLKPHRADIAIICGREVSHLAHEVLRIEKRARFRVFMPAWRRGPAHFKVERKELDRVGYHLVLPSQRTFLAGWEKAHPHVHFVDRGFDPEVFYPAPEEDKTRGIVFCGNHDAFGRLAKLQTLLAHFPGQVEWTQGIRSHSEMAEFLRSAKIGWNQILRGAPTNTVGINYRVWETLGSKLLLLCSYSSCVARVLRDGVQVVFWRSIEELLEKARYYLKHDDERIAIAKAGHEEALRAHTWGHRALEIKALVERYL